MNPISASVWLTATEAAEYLKVKPRSLLRWVRLGKIKGYTLSGTKRRVWRFRKEDLDSALFKSSDNLSFVSRALEKGGSD